MTRNPWMGVLVVPAILALVTGGRDFAQESNGSPDGLYAVPGTTQESASNRSAQSYLSTLDPQGEQFNRDLEKANVVRKAADDARRLKRQAAGGGSQWAASTQILSERAWIAILVGAGLLASLTAAGYVWWSRTQYSRNNPVLLAMRRGPVARPDDS
jgi:hypothetical protein